MATFANQVTTSINTNGALGFNIGHWLKSMMNPNDYLWWKSMFEGVLYLNRVTYIVELDAILLKKMLDDEDNLEFKI